MTSAEISKGIEDLTIEAFDRVQPHVERYAQDERRLSPGEQGMTMAAHISAFSDLENRYGFMDLRVCQGVSRLAIAKMFVSAPVMQGVLTELGIADYSDVDLSKEVSPEDLSVRSDIKFRVLRDSYPKGWTGGLGDPDFYGGDAYDPDIIGERHRIAITSRMLLEGSALPGRELWDIDFSLSDRFDKPDSQTKYTVEVKKLKKDTSPTEGPEQEPLCKKKRRETTEEDLEFLAATVRRAKDLRPVVHPIRKHVRYGRSLDRMTAEIYGSADEQQAA
jgi:hypothetical protein